MLVNKGDKVTVKYNGIEITVVPGGKLDVRDFDISTGQNTLPLKSIIPGVEKFILKKYPGQFEVTDQADESKVSNEHAAQIVALKAVIEGLEAQIKAKDELLASSNRKNAEDAAQINGFGSIEKGLKDQIAALKAQLESEVEDNKAVLKRIRGGK